MLHFDYSWDLSPNGIMLDQELNVDKLGWKNGDYFEMKNVNDRVMLVKVDPLVAFIRQGAEDVVKQIQVNVDERYG